MSERGGRLIGLLSVLLAVAVLTRCFLLLGQLGLRGQQGGEGEEPGGGGDGGEGGLAQSQWQGGHWQSQALELRQLVSLELLLHRMTTRHSLDRDGLTQESNRSVTGRPIAGHKSRLIFNPGGPQPQDRWRRTTVLSSRWDVSRSDSKTIQCGVTKK